MTKLIDRLMPYRVVAENYLLKVNDELEIQMQGFTKRFAKPAKLEKYLKRKLNDKTFDWNYSVENNIYHVYPGQFSIAKAAAGI